MARRNNLQASTFTNLGCNALEILEASIDNFKASYVRFVYTLRILPTHLFDDIVSA